MACCIVDTVDKIAGLAKLFFAELSKKGDQTFLKTNDYLIISLLGNTLYNVMPDIVSRLSDSEKGLN